jgi:hypothetical protein
MATKLTDTKEDNTRKAYLLLQEYIDFKKDSKNSMYSFLKKGIKESYTGVELSKYEDDDAMKLLTMNENERLFGFLGITRQTFSSWKNKKSKISKSFIKIRIAFLFKFYDIWETTYNSEEEFVEIAQKKVQEFSKRNDILTISEFLFSKDKSYRESSRKFMCDLLINIYNYPSDFYNMVMESMDTDDHMEILNLIEKSEIDYGDIFTLVVGYILVERSVLDEVDEILNIWNDYQSIPIWKRWLYSDRKVEIKKRFKEFFRMIFQLNELSLFSTIYVRNQYDKEQIEKIDKVLALNDKLFK